MIFSLSDGMKRIDVPENHNKNNLPLGTVLQLEGHTTPKYVIVESKGIHPRFPGYGAQYVCVHLETLQFVRHDAYELKYISEKKDGRIQTYITDEILPCDDILEYREKALAKKKRFEEHQEQKAAETQRLIELGKELFRKHIPENAKALIVARYEVDESDIQSDYHGTSTRGLVILGYSMHTRDLFTEMRKHAHKIPETAHLAAVPTENSNGEERTDRNKSWWIPADEHREKYSMGSGYYLKASSKYSTGWTIFKHGKHGHWYDEHYVSIAKRNIFA